MPETGTEAFRHLVLVNGCPGTGKTWLAGRLASRLGYPLLCRDRVKESLFEALPVPGDVEPLAWSRQVGQVAFHVFWQLAGDLGPVAILEAHFRPEFAVPELSKLCALPTEVFLTASATVTHRRWWSRVESGERHRAHSAYPLPDLGQVGAALADWVPLDLGGPLLCLDTTEGIDVDPVADWVRSQAPPEC